jgi:hypothetical protein
MACSRVNFTEVLEIQNAVDIYDRTLSVHGQRFEAHAQKFTAAAVQNGDPLGKVASLEVPGVTRFCGLQNCRQPISIDSAWKCRTMM